MLFVFFFPQKYAISQVRRIFYELIIYENGVGKYFSAKKMIEIIMFMLHQAILEDNIKFLELNLMRLFIYYGVLK